MTRKELRAIVADLRKAKQSDHLSGFFKKRKIELLEKKIREFFPKRS